MLRNKSAFADSGEDVAPERSLIPDMKLGLGASVTDKRSNNKYLLPQQRTENWQQAMISSGFPHLKVANAKSFKEPL